MSTTIVLPEHAARQPPRDRERHRPAARLGGAAIGVCIFGSFADHMAAHNVSHTPAPRGNHRCPRAAHPNASRGGAVAEGSVTCETATPIVCLPSPPPFPRHPARIAGGGCRRARPLLGTSPCSLLFGLPPPLVPHLPNHLSAACVTIFEP